MLSKFENLIISIARKYRLIGIERDDLIQEGWVAVIENQEKWSLIDKNEALAFMTPFIRRAMRDYCISNQRIVKIVKTKGEIKAVNNLLSYVSSESELNQDVILKMSSDLKIKEKDVLAASGFVFGSDATITAEGKVSYSYGDRELPDSSTLGMISERIVNLVALDESIIELEPREHKIIYSRWFCDEKAPLREIALDLGISTSGVAYLEAQAISTIRISIQSRLAA